MSKETIENNKTEREDRTDHYIDAVRDAIQAVKRFKLPWYKRLWRFVKKLIYD